MSHFNGLLIAGLTAGSFELVVPAKTCISHKRRGYFSLDPCQIKPSTQKAYLLILGR
jgi:hypothetical protein